MALGSHLSPEEFAAYIDGRTTRPERQRVIAHLAVCDACFRELLAILRLVKDQPGGPRDHP